MNMNMNMKQEQTIMLTLTLILLLVIGFLYFYEFDSDSDSDSDSTTSSPDSTGSYTYTKYTDKGIISGYEDRETNLTGCKALCESLDDCIGFVMDKSQTKCWAKNSLYNMIDDTGFDTYRINNEQFDADADGPWLPYTKQSNKIKYGRPVAGNSGTYSGNLAECKVLCDSLDECGGFTMDKSQTECWVKTNISVLETDDGYDTYGKPGGGVTPLTHAGSGRAGEAEH
jgi:hypothetical protein